MIALSFLSMFVLMYAMMDTFANVYASLDQLYMAGLMTAPMLVIELLVMNGIITARHGTPPSSASASPPQSRSSW